MRRFDMPNISKTKGIGIQIAMCVAVIVFVLMISIIVWDKIDHRKKSTPSRTETLIMRTSAMEYREDGWVFCFIHHQLKDPVLEQNADGLRYQFFGLNLRYAYKGAALYQEETTIQGTRMLATINPGFQVWGEQSEAQRRDMKLIYDEILIQSASVSELQAINEKDYMFEELDGEMFFRLMNESLTSDPDPEPTDLTHMDLPTYGMLQEPNFIDGYKFQIGFVSSMGFVDEIFIDLLYEDSNEECGYYQLSDLVDSGSASSDQEKLFWEIVRTMDLVRGREDIVGSIGDMNTEMIADVNMERLHIMLNNLGNYEYSEYAVGPKVIHAETIKQ